MRLPVRKDTAADGLIPIRNWFYIPLLIRFDSTATNDTNLHEMHKMHKT